MFEKKPFGIESRPNVFCVVSKGLLGGQSRECIDYTNIANLTMKSRFGRSRIECEIDDGRKIRIDNLPDESATEVFNMVQDRRSEIRNRFTIRF